MYIPFNTSHVIGATQHHARATQHLRPVTQHEALVTQHLRAATRREERVTQHVRPPLDMKGEPLNMTVQPLDMKSESLHIFVQPLDMRANHSTCSNIEKSALPSHWLLELAFIKFRIKSVCLKQLFMRSLFNHRALVHHENDVGVLNGRQTVR